MLPNYYIFLFILMSSTILSMSSNSWLGAWMGMEMNLLVFIPLMSNLKNCFSTESSMKYFLIQAFASSLLLFSSFLIHMNFLFNLNYILLMSTLLLKMGAAPLHFWFPLVSEGLTWKMNMILMTWQKLAPMTLISYISFNLSILLQIISLISIIVGSILGLNQTSMRKIMAYSSINHMGWMISTFFLNKVLWKIYFIVYSFLTILILQIFNNYKIYFFNQMFMTNNMNKTMKFITFCNFLSLGGLPPFLGFLPKWFILNNLIMNNYYMLMTIMSIFTLINMFYYLRLSMNSLLYLNLQLKWNLSNYYYSMNIILTFCSMFGLMLSFIFFY
uniref:NADH-ubiquinone oxidoreductase chain 2 n=1 Tax=Mongoloraphidia harmandi TaxID=633873 RepID=C8YXB7_9NEOP|nr:NADH dehydrogenase subunit 2 [Mongoloraphidia harmandi]ACO92551.1 NADH dehydrogenase subunit 2 [Mongoloraphidia harmandi]